MFLNEKAWTLIKTSLEYVNKGPLGQDQAGLGNYPNQWWFSFLNASLSLNG